MAAVDAMREDPGPAAGRLLRRREGGGFVGYKRCAFLPGISRLFHPAGTGAPRYRGGWHPFSENAGICAALLRSGISCYSEKPAATDARGLAALEEVLQHTGAYYTNMLEMRAFPHFLAMRGAVGQGLIGEIRLVHVQKSYRLGVRPSFYTRRESYGGTIPGWARTPSTSSSGFVRLVCTPALHGTAARAARPERWKGAPCAPFPWRGAALRAPPWIFCVRRARPPTPTTACASRGAGACWKPSSAE